MVVRIYNRATRSGPWCPPPDVTPECTPAGHRIGTSGRRFTSSAKINRGYDIYYTQICDRTFAKQVTAHDGRRSRGLRGYLHAPELDKSFNVLRRMLPRQAIPGPRYCRRSSPRCSRFSVPFFIVFSFTLGLRGPRPNPDPGSTFRP